MVRSPAQSDACNWIGDENAYSSPHALIPIEKRGWGCFAPVEALAGKVRLEGILSIVVTGDTYVATHFVQAGAQSHRDAIGQGFVRPRPDYRWYRAVGFVGKIRGDDGEAPLVVPLVQDVRKRIEHPQCGALAAEVVEHERLGLEYRPQNLLLGHRRLGVIRALDLSKQRAIIGKARLGRDAPLDKDPSEDRDPEMSLPYSRRTTKKQASLDIREGFRPILGDTFGMLQARLQAVEGPAAAPAIECTLLIAARDTALEHRRLTRATRAATAAYDAVDAIADDPLERRSLALWTGFRQKRSFIPRRDPSLS